MPDPTIFRTDPRFAEAVARQLRQLDQFEEAEETGRSIGRNATTLRAVHDALLSLQAEVRQLREAIQPTASPLITGGDAMREYRALTTPRT